MKELKKILPYFKPYIFKLFISLICMSGVSLISSAAVMILKFLIDVVLIEKDLNSLFDVVVLVIIFYALKDFFQYVYEYLLIYISQSITKTIRNNLYQNVINLSLDFFHKSSTADITSRFTNDTFVLEKSLYNVPSSAIKETMTMIFLIGILFYLNFKFSLYSLILAPIAGLIIARIGKKLRFIGRQSQDRMAHLYHQIQESLQAIPVVKLFQKENFETERFKKINLRFFDTIMRFNRTGVLSGPLIEFIGALIFAGIIGFGGLEVINGKWTLGSFIAYIGALTSMYLPIKRLSEINVYFQQGMAAYSRILEIIEQKIVVESENAINIKEFKNSIEFKNVNFSYSDKNPILKNLSFKISCGESVGIIGPSGSGKSTIAYLLLKFFNPDSGEILIDGINLNQISTKSLRNIISLVMQESFLFNDTIYANICYGKENPDIDEVEKVIDLSYVREFLEHLPSGKNTKVGERGVTLSGGQKQRIAIARALLKNPSILIFDEAISGLDPESEKYLQSAIEELMKNRTTIFITHRLSSIKNVDKILILYNGEIIETGSPKELFQKESIYRKLVEIQLG